MLFLQLIFLFSVCKSLKGIHLNNDNFVSLRGPVSSTSIAELIANLLDKHYDERYIYFNTNG